MSSTPTYNNLDALIEQPDSGAYESGAQLTKTLIYAAKYAVCVAALKTKGTLGTGSLLGFVLNTSTVTRSRGDLGKLVDVWVAGGDDADPGVTPLPPDEVNVQSTNSGPRVERHPLFKSLGSLTVGSVSLMSCIDNVIRAPDRIQREIALTKITSSGLTAPQIALAQLLISKIEGGQESYYEAQFRYSWATYSYTIPSLSAGGVRETPGGPLSSYFSGTLSFLREADELQYLSGVWRHTSAWLGANTHGYSGAGWDSDLYP